MPTSQHHQIPKILDLVMAADPMSVLDVGVGFGKYGFLAREYLEVWNEHEIYARRTRRIDGVEVFTDYLTPVHDYVYDHIYEGDALEIVPGLEASYDLVLIIDVLEHFDKESGRQLLTALLGRARGVLVSVPKDTGSQGEVFGNVHETHHAGWSKRDLAKLAPACFVRDKESVIAYLGRPDDIRRIKSDLFKKSVRRQAASSPVLTSALRRTSSRIARWRSKPGK